MRCWALGLRQDHHAQHHVGPAVPSQGKVLFDGRDVTRATPQQRNIAQVFQFPVIYDTMTVAENLAFPLRNRKVPEAQIRSSAWARSPRCWR
jgi:glycerol transport system ATP-binding protein